MTAKFTVALWNSSSCSVLVMFDIATDILVLMWLKSVVKTSKIIHLQYLYIITDPTYALYSKSMRTMIQGSPEWGTGNLPIPN